MKVTYVSRRSDLVKEGDLIPLFTNWDDAKSDQKEFTHVRQDEWIRTFGQDDDGLVFTPVGIYLSIDLDFLEREE